MFRKITKAFVVISELMVCSVAAAAPPIVFIENPSGGGSQSGIITFYGWAIGPTAPVQKVTIFLDDNVGRLEIPYGGSRVDVAAAFPGVPGADRSGFSIALNTRNTTNGVHSLSAEVVAQNGETKTSKVTFLVSNTPGQDNPTTVQLDLTGARTRVVGSTEILVEGVKINGQALVTVLKFDPNSNHFILPSFVDDPKRSGFRDDDKNRDGFSDKDGDRDGFADDDLNRDGLSDNVNTNANTNTNTNINTNTNSNSNSNTNTNTNTNSNSNSNTNTNTNTNTNSNSNSNSNSNGNTNANSNGNKNLRVR